MPTGLARWRLLPKEQIRVPHVPPLGHGTGRRLVRPPSVGLSGISSSPITNKCHPERDAKRESKDLRFQRSRLQNKMRVPYPTSRVWDVGYSGQQSARWKRGVLTPRKERNTKEAFRPGLFDHRKSQLLIRDLSSRPKRSAVERPTVPAISKSKQVRVPHVPRLGHGKGRTAVRPGGSMGL